MNCLRSVIGLLAFFCSATFGATIAINSSAATTSNDSGSPTIEILKHPAWADPFEGSAWVSTRDSGDATQTSFFEFDNGTTITFSHVFNLPSVATDGLLSVRADDTTSVTLNGVLILAASTISGQACSAIAIGCLTSTTGVLAFSALQPHLVQGANVLSFGVQQRDGSALGLTYSGSISYAAPTPRDVGSPEPASFLLSATGLLIGVLIVRRRAKRPVL